jgi:hemoglobin/transferrin/lactoferrin receptor protein
MRSLLLCCWLLAWFGGAAQVQVRDATSLRAVEGVAVLLGADQRRLFTDGDGRVLLPPAMLTDTVEVSHQAYFTIRMRVGELLQQGTLFLLPRSVALAEFVVAANRFKEPRSDVPEHLQVIDAAALQRMDQPTTGDVLQQHGAVFLQKSQSGGGSPVIRGFEASRVLLVVDGVRLNNAIYRSGHLQDIMTVDPNALERVEVISGPASVVYGSDALGGVVHLFTRQAPFSDSMTVSGGAFVRAASAASERTVHAHAVISTARFSSLTSITAMQLGDLRQGRQRAARYDSLGLRFFQVERSDDRDVIVLNDRPHVQLGTAYSQLDVLQKFRYRSGERTVHQLNLQHSISSALPRYDRLSEYRVDPVQGIVPVHAQWYYGPQRRVLAAYTLEVDRTSIADVARFTPSFQYVEQSRHNRSWGSQRLGHRLEEVQVLGFNADLEKRSGRHEWRYGGEATANAVRSTAWREDLRTGERSYLSTRYPNGGSSMYSAALYLTHTYERKRWVLSEGVRMNSVGLRATFADANDLQFLNGTVRQDHAALNWRLGALYRPDSTWRISALLNTGFRAPNVDDLGKVFDSAPGLVVVPNTDLGPERTLNAELGVERQITGRWTAAVQLFHTWYTNALVQRPFTWNGSDSLVYDEVPSAVTALTNAGRAYIAGGSAQVQLQVGRRMGVQGSITHTVGRVLEAGGTVPLDHVPPTFGRLAWELRMRRVEASVFALFNGWKRRADYSAIGEDNLQYALPEGMPAWWTLNARAAITLHPAWRLQMGVENILDRFYRVLASGVSAPGRNVQVSLHVRF